MTLEVVPFSSASSEIDGLKIIHVKMVTDERGTVRELFRQSQHSQVLVNGAVRGLHGEAMSKLVTVAHGEAFGAYVDTRRDSPTLGSVVTVRLTPGVQVFVPQGVCNGFQAVADDTEYLYFFDNEWQKGMTGVALTPLDPDLGIEWPIAIKPDNLAQISKKDSEAPTLKEVLKQLAETRPKE